MEGKASEMKGERIYIKKMREEDLEEVMAIERVSFPSPWMRSMFLRELRDSSPSHFLVARIHKHLVGYGGFSVIFGEAHIDNLAVHPDFRRRKIGEKLLAAMLGLARSEGVREIILEVRAGNLPAQNLYRKFGFRAVGRHRQYYHDTQEDALLMSLNLST